MASSPKTLAEAAAGDRLDVVVRVVVTDAREAKHRDGVLMVRPTRLVEVLRRKEGAIAYDELVHEGSTWNDGEPFYLPLSTKVVRPVVLNGHWVQGQH